MADRPRYAIECGKNGMSLAQPDGRFDAPAFHRNHEPIGAVLDKFLAGETGDVLEIGGGTGQHAVAFADRMPSITWWPTDLNDGHLRSIEAWRDHAGLGNVEPPVRLDASAADWCLDTLGLPHHFTAMFCANVIHISPWAVAEGLFAGAARHLQPGGRLFLYGPFRRDGRHNAPSNAEFDESLRRRDPQWGVRDIADVKMLGESHGLQFAELIEMPSNNAVAVFERAT